MRVAHLVPLAASVTVALLSLMAPAACTLNDAADGGAGEGGAGVDAGPVILKTPAANIDAPFVFKSLADVTVTAATCSIDTDTGTSNCWDPASVDFRTQPSTTWEAGAFGSSIPELAIFSMGTLTTAPNTQITVHGSRALVLISKGQMYLAGTIDVSANGAAGGPGGFSGNKSGNLGGLGVAPGAAPDGTMHGAGGGALCGAGGNATGGKQALSVTAPVTSVPLIGGSSGGSGYQSGGGGGGAIELVTDAILTLTIQSVLKANGAGAEFGGGGGGAGGMILVEADGLNPDGALLANGGGGSANTSAGDVTLAAGKPGANDATSQAAGGQGANAGGAGSGSASLAGADGVYDTPSPGASLGNYGGGGGGGAGLIRLRATAGGTGSTLQVSPSGADCFHRGFFK